MANKEISMQDALKTIISNLENVEVRGHQNMNLIIESEKLANACLEAANRPAQEPELEITDFRELTDEEAKAQGLIPKE